MLLEHRKTQNESAEEEQELSEVFMKTLNYTQKFSRYKNRETIAHVRRYVCKQWKILDFLYYLRIKTNIKPWPNGLTSWQKFWTCVQLAFRLATHLRQLHRLATICVDYYYYYYYYYYYIIIKIHYCTSPGYRPIRNMAATN